MDEKFLTRFTQEKELFNVKLAQCGCRCRQLSCFLRFICTHLRHDVQFTRVERFTLTFAICLFGEQYLYE